jgi:hypothetical protein
LFPWGRNEFNGAFPDTTGDSRGGGGGGGGGAVELRSLESITLFWTARILAAGGTGGGGEINGGSRWGGGGGGGSGGAVVLRSAGTIQINSGAQIQVQGGAGNRGNTAKGVGGDGIVQLQTPINSQATVEGTITPIEAWVDPGNAINPSEFSPLSTAVSHWIDVGRATERPPPGTNPVFSFGGTDALTGRVLTDSAGFIEDPDSKPFRIDYLGRRDPVTRRYLPGEEPLADWIPPSAEVFIEFQGADALAEGSREVDVKNASSWHPDPGFVGNGRQFIRWRVRFDVAVDGQPISASTKRPVVQDLRLDFQF